MGEVMEGRYLLRGIRNQDLRLFHAWSCPEYYRLRKLFLRSESHRYVWSVLQSVSLR